MGDGTITMDPETILHEMELFYQSLYTPEVVGDVDKYFDKLTRPQDIATEDYSNMEKEITEAELLKIIKTLPNNKTPGEDGLPAEFYKVFWLDIKMLLLNSYKHSYENSLLSIT